MAGPPRGRGPRPRRARLVGLAAAAVVLVLAVLATGGALLLHRGGSGPAAGVPTPRTTGATVGAGASASRGPLLPAVPAAGAVATAAGVQAVLAPLLTAPALGPGVVASVVDATTGTRVWDQQGDTAVLPASTAKIATAVAVLTGLPGATTLSTRVVAGPGAGSVVLVGGGDPTLAGPAAPPTAGPSPARLVDLAAQVRAARAGAPVTSVLVDDTAFTGPTTAPGWRPSYLAGDVAPVTGLSVDAGRAAPTQAARVADPPLAAGRALAALLGAPAAAVARGAAPPGAATLGEVRSPSLGDLVEGMLTRSDNDLAEALARRLAVQQGRPASFAGAAAAVQAGLSGLVPDGAVSLADASGLSRDDRVRASAVTALLSAVVRDRTGRLGPVLSGLPVGGFDGTLAARFRSDPAVAAAGEVRGKTGTLEGVSALAGLVRTADGQLLAFDLTANGAAARAAAEAALDRAAAVLTACGCR